MAFHTLYVQTKGEGLYSITPQLKEGLQKLLAKDLKSSGVFYAFILHTSCALLISENYDPSAKEDLEAFFKYLVPRDLPFVEHTLEGPDDSPSHMKSALLHQHIALPVEEGQLVLGQWQGVFLAEFRDSSKKRSVLLKFIQE